jgi:hypothetical protein
MTRKRLNIKEIIADPILRKELVDGATDFICKVEAIRLSFETKSGEAAFNANRDEGLPAALRCIANRWAAEIKGQPKTEFIGGISNCIETLNEIAFDIEQTTKPTSEGELE